MSAAFNSKSVGTTELPAWDTPKSSHSKVPLGYRWGNAVPSNLGPWRAGQQQDNYEKIAMGHSYYAGDYVERHTGNRTAACQKNAPTSASEYKYVCAYFFNIIYENDVCCQSCVSTAFPMVSNCLFYTFMLLTNLSSYTFKLFSNTFQMLPKGSPMLFQWHPPLNGMSIEGAGRRRFCRMALPNPEKEDECLMAVSKGHPAHRQCVEKCRRRVLSRWQALGATDKE